MCDHSPLSQEDCKVNSNLRTTVAVFLRTAEKKWAVKKAKGEVVEAPPKAEEPVKVEERKEQAPAAAAPEEDVVKVVSTEAAEEGGETAAAPEGEGKVYEPCTGRREGKGLIVCRKWNLRSNHRGRCARRGVKLLRLPSRTRSRLPPSQPQRPITLDTPLPPRTDGTRETR